MMPVSAEPWFTRESMRLDVFPSNIDRFSTNSRVHWTCKHKRKGWPRFISPLCVNIGRIVFSCACDWRPVLECNLAGSSIVPRDARNATVHRDQVVVVHQVVLQAPLCLHFLLQTCSTCFTLSSFSLSICYKILDEALFFSWGLSQHH